MNEDRKLDDSLLEKADGGVGLLDLGVRMARNDDFKRIMDKKSEMLQKEQKPGLHTDNEKEIKKQ